MERLLVQQDVGDGFTYSSVYTYPILYESKDKALFDLELLLNEYCELIKTHSIAMDVVNKKIAKLHMQLKKVKVIDKDMTEKLLALYTESRTLSSELPVSFNFGGQDLEYSSFFTSAITVIDLAMPRISSLNEYFDEVEKEFKNPVKKRI